MRRAVVALAGCCVLVAGGRALAGQAPTVKKSSGPLTATIVPGTHHPRINAKWPLSVTATLAGMPAHATSLYLFMLGPMVVSTQRPYGKNPYRFTGHYNDTFTWPADSLGQTLTLRVAVSAGGHTVDLDWAVTPVK